MEISMGIIGREVTLYVSESYPYKDALKDRGYKFYPGPEKSWYISKQFATNEEAVEWIRQELGYLFQLAIANWEPPRDAVIVGFVAIDARLAKLVETYGWQFDAPDAQGFVKIQRPSPKYLAYAEYYREGTPIADHYSKR